jgi:hypothetical protein
VFSSGCRPTAIVVLRLSALALSVAQETTVWCFSCVHRQQRCC